MLAMVGAALRYRWTRLHARVLSAIAVRQASPVSCPELGDAPESASSVDVAPADGVPSLYALLQLCLEWVSLTRFLLGDAFTGVEATHPLPPLPHPLNIAWTAAVHVLTTKALADAAAAESAQIAERAAEKALVRRRENERRTPANVSVDFSGVAEADRVLPPPPAKSKSPTILLPASNDSVLPVDANFTAPA